MTKEELIHAYADWLQKYNWTWFCTLTFKGAPPLKRADRLFRVWISEIKQSEGTKKFSWVRVTERGAFGDNIHFHALIGGLRDASKWRWMFRWEELAGEANILYYVPKLGGVQYMLKEARPGCDFDIEIEIAP
jgi:hypothetical protein